ncbi:MAG: hypothetical protein ACI9ZF_002000 [Bradyrhizobium sp.]|jgi:hypothetical protein
MTKHLFSLACLLALAACQSMSPSGGELLTPPAATAPATMAPEPVAPAGPMMPPDAGSAGSLIAPK